AQTGQGTALEVSLFEALAEWMGYAMYYTMGGTPPPRTGASHATIAPYGPHRTRDGEDVMFGIHNNRDWAIFATEVLDQPGLVNDPRFASNRLRVQNRVDLDREIDQVFLTLTTREVIDRLDAA